MSDSQRKWNYIATKLWDAAFSFVKLKHLKHKTLKP